MNHLEFKQILDGQIERCQETLLYKSKEYADDDERLHNFKVASEVTGTSAIQALAGMMVKHTVSIYDMCSSIDAFPTDVWDEKITDHINYLILLRALVYEDADNELKENLENRTPYANMKDNK
jgi:hypothetical protein